MFTPQQSTFGAFKQPEQSTFGAFKPPEQSTFGAFKPSEQSTFGTFKPSEQSTFGTFKQPENNIELKLEELNKKIDSILAILNEKNKEQNNTENNIKQYVLSKIHKHPLLETTRDKQGIEYKNGFSCDICAYVQQKEEYFYHCDECYNAKSKKLFDVCSECIKKQLI